MKRIFTIACALGYLIALENASAQVNCSATACYYYMSAGTQVLDVAKTNTFYDPSTPSAFQTPPAAVTAGVNCVPPSTPNDFNYLDSLDITETFTTSNGLCITVNFNPSPSYFGIHNNDTLFLYDGSTSLATLLGRWTNTNTQPTLTYSSSGPTITFRFVSDGSGNCKGWKVAFTYEECDTLTSAGNINDRSNPISVYPNPACGYVIVESGNNANEISGYRILSVMGEVLRSISTTFNEKEKIEISELNPGIFFLELEMQNGQREISLFSKSY